MITLCTIPAFTGTRTETIKALITAMALDAIYILPMILN